MKYKALLGLQRYATIMGLMSYDIEYVIKDVLKKFQNAETELNSYYSVWRQQEELETLLCDIADGGYSRVLHIIAEA